MLSTYAGCDAETVAEFQRADMEEEMTATTVTTGFFPEGFLDAMDGIAAAVVAAKPVRKARITLLASIKAGLLVGDIRPLEFGSDKNPTYNRHAYALYEAAQEQNRDALASYPIAGVNTYARALKGYRDLLVAHLDAKAAAVKPSKPKAAKAKKGAA